MKGALIVSQYRYEPLQPGHIRLIRLRHEGSRDDLSIDLISVSLSGEVPYYALSYVWGSSVRDCYVLCDGQKLLVPRSLVEALHGVKGKLVRQAMPIWIDAVCINQPDLEERRQQVTMMNSVYRGAMAVLIWLGPERDDSDLAMAFIGGCSKDLLLREGLPLQADLADHGFPPRGDPIWRAIGLLFSREWFFRLWTFQEIVLATEANVFCGTIEVPWSMMELVGCMICSKRTWVYAISEETQDVLVRGLQSTVNIGITGWNYRSPELRKKFMSLSHLLTISWTKRCLEPRDRIYAILALTEQEFRDQIVVDYDTSNPVAELYIQFGKLALKQDPHLYYLKLASVQNPTRGLPSWCVDPSGDLSRISRSRDCCRAGILSDSDVARIETELHQPNQIRIEGFRVDIVDDVIAMEFDWQLRAGVQNSKNVVAWEAKCLQLACKTLKWQLKDIPIAHVCVLAGAPQPWQHGSQHTISHGYEYSMEHLRSQACSRKTFHIPSERMNCFVAYGRDMLQTCPGRSYFSTIGGRIGIGSPGLKRGDVLVILYGAGPMFILRQQNGRPWRFIGDAFVHGFMDLEHTRAEDINETEWFVID